jgi:hypothetical protein
MEFGYFTLSDNHYTNNTRSPNQFVDDITAEALYADELGMHSAWIGEHHFNSLGVLSCPDLVLAYIAARTKHIRLAPAVTVLPLHHPIRVAEQWATLDLLSNGRVDFAAGRGYDPKTAPPSYRYFIDMVERLHKVKPEDLTENSVLIGSSARMTETLKKVEAAGFSEVILYFNVGLKPHPQVKEEMDRFMREVAPQFEGLHRQRRAA